MTKLLDDYLKCRQCPKVARPERAVERGWVLLGRLGTEEPSVFCSAACAVDYLTSGALPEQDDPRLIIGDIPQDILDAAEADGS